MQPTFLLERNGHSFLGGGGREGGAGHLCLALECACLSHAPCSVLALAPSIKLAQDWSLPEADILNLLSASFSLRKLEVFLPLLLRDLHRTFYLHFLMLVTS